MQKIRDGKRLANFFHAKGSNLNFSKKALIL